MIKRGDIPILVQLVGSLEEAEVKLEYFYRKGDIENFDKTKRFMLRVQKKISEMVK